MKYRPIAVDGIVYKTTSDVDERLQMNNKTLNTYLAQGKRMLQGHAIRYASKEEIALHFPELIKDEPAGSGFDRWLAKRPRRPRPDEPVRHAGALLTRVATMRLGHSQGGR